MSKRRVTLVMTTIVVGAVLLLAWALSVRGRAGAHAPHTWLSFHIGIDVNGDSNDDCLTNYGPQTAKCTISSGATFTLKVYLDGPLPVDIPSYEAFDLYVTYTGVASKDNPIASFGTPCGYTFVATPPVLGRVLWGCTTGIGGSGSTWTGLVGTAGFNCAASGTISLQHGLGRTWLVDDSGKHAEGNGTSETLLINCSTPTITPSGTPPTSTFTPTPTATVVPHQGNIFPVAGGHVGDGLTGPNAALSSPNAVALSGTSVYIADTGHCRVRRIDNAGTTSTVAGTGTCGYAGEDGAATSADLNHPKGIAFIGNDLYISDSDNCRVRKVVPGANSIIDGAGDETITRIAGDGTCAYNGEGTATTKQVNHPAGLAAAGTDLYIADTDNCRVRKITSGTISTVAGTGTCGFDGDGTATTKQLNKPAGVVVDGANLYIADTDNCLVRKVTGTSMSTVAGKAPNPVTDPPNCGYDGDGTATAMLLNKPAGVVVGGTDVYIADTDNCRVRKVTAGSISLYAGTGTCGFADNADPTLARLDHPTGLAYGSSTLYIADRDNHRVRKIGSPISTVAGTGLPSFCGDSRVAVQFSCLSSPSDVVVDPSGNVYIADAGNHRVRKIDSGTANISTFAGKTEQTSCPTDSGSSATALCLASPQHLAVSPSDGLLYVSDRDGHTVWRVNLGSGAFSRVAGNGSAAVTACVDNTSSLNACLDQPAGLEVQQVSSTDTYLFIAEEGNGGRVLRVDLLTNRIWTVFNDGGAITTDVAVGPEGSLYVAEPAAGLIKRVATGGDGHVDGTVTDPGETSAVVAGGGGSDPIADGIAPLTASLDYPSGVEMDMDAHLLISERDDHRIWVVTPGTVTGNIVDGEAAERIYRIAGGGAPTPGFCGDPDIYPTPTPTVVHNARTACLNLPADLSFGDFDAALYFADRGNERVRRIPSDCDDDGITDKKEQSTPDPAQATPTPPDGYASYPNSIEHCDSDTDDDGCTDSQELGLDANGGGQRYPTYHWDYFNPTQDGVNRTDDITAVIIHYGHDVGDPLYGTRYDRGGALSGGHVWQFNPPNGTIRTSDITAAVLSYGHDCGPYS